MDHLSIDIETFSSVDIKKSGLYKYVQSADFQILLFAYSVDGAAPVVLDLTTQRGCDQLNALMTYLFNADVVKHAYNAAFEWYCISKHFGLDAEAAALWLRQWRCTMLHGLYCGYTAGLAATGEAIGLPSDKRKLQTGNALIKTFCTPNTSATAKRIRTLPSHEPEKWELFKQYCAQDVITEAAIENRLTAHPVPENEERLWQLDQLINARGVAVDMRLVNGAITIGNVTAQQLTEEAQRISGLNNPKSVAQLQKWLSEELPEEELQDVNDLRKDTVAQLLEKGVSSDAATRMLEIRQLLSKTSTKKYDAMLSAVCDDGRMRGLLQFYGANRTGRWAGRLVQVQNLPRNYSKHLDLARNLTTQQRADSLKFCFGNVPDILSQLIRTAFVPAPGNQIIVADFSAIEARIIAWLAGEQWVNEVFATHGKIYEAQASQMFGVPVELIKKGNPEYALRQKGKVATLALGYQGSTNSLIAMGALQMGLTEAELPDIVRRWRSANKRIVDLWYAMETLAIKVVSTGMPGGVHGLILSLSASSGHRYLTIRLPSGRQLYYVDPYLTLNRWGSQSIGYWGMDQKTKKWGRVETYGGKLVENTVQAIARDCLAVAMQRLDAAGHRIVMHIHDEVVIDAPMEATLEDACSIMGQPIEWAPGLLLRADGFVNHYYKKD